MIEVRICDEIAPEDVTAVHELGEAAEAADGHPALNDDATRALATPDPRSRLLLASEDASTVGALVLFPHDGAPVGNFSSLVIVHPEHRGLDIDTALVRVATEEVHTAGGTRFQLLALGAGAAADALAASARLDAEREFHQMRITLPLGEPPRWPDGTSVRTFIPGQDEEAWVEVNARAFAWDPDQGNWSVQTLQQRETEPWFDPAGFLLAIDDAGIAGFCWTKIHPPTPREPEALGEIYVIGVDPDRQGTGLGRALVSAGLVSLHKRGTRTGMLFVDGANTAAVALYRGLGFTTTRVDRLYGLALR